MEKGLLIMLGIKGGHSTLLLAFPFPSLAAMDADLHENISNLTLNEIRQLSSGQIVIPYTLRSQKNNLVEYLLSHGSPEIVECLRVAALAKIAQKKDREERNKSDQKRKRVTDQIRRRVAAKTEASNVPEERNLSKFLELPSPDQVVQCFHEFYQATSRKSLEMAVCAVCAREVTCAKNNVISVKLTDIPNSRRLIPKNPHPEHILTQGLLLEASGLHHSQKGVLYAKICRECFEDLQDRKLPRLSLANDMWIGRVPWELDRLTLPEQMLIALLYPRVYVFKLHTKSGYDPDVSTLQRAM